MIARRARSLSGVALICALATASLASGEEPFPPGEVPPAQAEAPEKAPAPAKADAKPAEKEPKVLLPLAGAYPAAHILSLVARVSGRKVQAASRELLERQVLISAELGGRDCSLDELKVVLAAHGIYLHERRRDDGTLAWLASRELQRQEDDVAPRFTRICELPPRQLARAVAVLERHLEERQGPETITYAPAPRSGRLIIQASSAAALEEIEELLRKMARLEAELEADRARMVTFEPRHRRGAELCEALLGELAEEEAAALRLVQPRKTNLIVLRGRGALLDRALRLLEKADTPRERADVRIDGEPQEPKTRPREPPGRD